MVIAVLVLVAALIQTSEAASWGRSVTIQNAQGTTHRRISGTYGGGSASRMPRQRHLTGRAFTNKTNATRLREIAEYLGWSVSKTKVRILRSKRL